MTNTNKIGLGIMLISVVVGITIYLTVGNTMEVFYAVPTLIIGANLYENT